MRKMLMGVALLCANTAGAATLMTETRQIANNLSYGQGTSYAKTYYFPGGCGFVTQTVYKGRPLCQQKADVCGVLRYTMPNGYGGCFQYDAAEWFGLDRPGGPDANDRIKQWRQVSCRYTGHREGKYGRVVDCLNGGNLNDIE